MIDSPTTTQLAPRERFAWVLMPLALVAYGVALLSLLSALISAGAAIGAVSSDAPVPVTLHTETHLTAKPGTHSYSGGPYVPDGAQVLATSVITQVSGTDAPTRVALQLGLTLWSATAVLVASAIGLTLTRLRGHDAQQSASRPALVATIGLAVGSTVAQIVSAWANMRLGHVAWIGEHGLTAFTAIDDPAFDLTPLGAAAALLVVVLLVRRGEHTIQG
jgi:hypothetical protein